MYELNTIIQNGVNDAVNIYVDQQYSDIVSQILATAPPGTTVAQFNAAAVAAGSPEPPIPDEKTFRLRIIDNINNLLNSEILPNLWNSWYEIPYINVPFPMSVVGFCGNYGFGIAFIGAIFYGIKNIVETDPASILVNNNISIAINILIGICGFTSIGIWFFANDIENFIKNLALTQLSKLMGQISAFPTGGSGANPNAAAAAAAGAAAAAAATSVGLSQAATDKCGK